MTETDVQNQTGDGFVNVLLGIFRARVRAASHVINDFPKIISGRDINHKSDSSLWECDTRSSTIVEQDGCCMPSQRSERAQARISQQ